METFYDKVKKIVDERRIEVGDNKELFPDNHLGIQYSELKFNKNENIYNFLVKDINVSKYMEFIQSPKSSECYLPDTLISDYENQKNYITKIVILNSYPGNNCFNANVLLDPDLPSFKYSQADLLSHVFRNDLRSDVDFAKTILSINGKFLSFFDESITTDPKMVGLSIINDKTDYLKSFMDTITSNNDVIKDYKVGLSFISKGLQTMDNNVDALYEEVFEKKFHEPFTAGLAWNNDGVILYDWLSNVKFVRELMTINEDFVDYITTDGKIAHMNDNSDIKVKTI